MAAPNIASLTTITGETAVTALSTTGATVVLNNAAASGAALKVNFIRVTNVDGTNSATITLTYNSADDGAGTAYALASTVTVPADAAIDILTEGPIYLEEDRSLVATASAANDLVVVVSYEDLS